MDEERGVAERFVERLVAQDREGLLELMAPTVRMRGMAPGRTWDAADATTLVDEVLLGDFFGESTEVVGVLARRFGGVQDINSATYQLRMRQGNQELECEQHTFFDIEAGRIHALHLLCSGFRPVDRD